MLLDVDGGEHVLAHQPLVEQDGVLVVVAFPCDEADQHVLAQRNLALRAGGTVGNDLIERNVLAHGDDRALIDAGALVGAGELGQSVVLDLAVVIADRNAVGADAGHGSLALRLNADLGVHGALLLNTGRDNRRLRYHQRHRLTLHIRTHQGTVRVVVLQEGDERRCDGGHHLRRNIEIVDHLAVNGDNLVAVAAGDTGVEQHTVLIDRLLCLRNEVVVLGIGSHVLPPIGNM